jgi:hypothetical protein
LICLKAKRGAGKNIEILIKVALAHPAARRLSDNSISGRKHVINKVSKAFKSKKKEFSYY